MRLVGTLLLLATAVGGYSLQSFAAKNAGDKPLATQIMEVLNACDITLSNSKNSVVVAPPVPDVFREEVKLRFPFSQAPDSYSLGSRYSSNQSRRLLSGRENVSVNLYPQGQPEWLIEQMLLGRSQVSALDYTPSTNSIGNSNTSRQNLGYDGSSRGAMTTRNSGGAVGSYNSRVPVAQNVDLGMMMAYVQAVYKENPLSHDVVVNVARSLMTDPYSVAQARATLQIYQDAKYLTLSTDGDDRYFKFTPYGHTSMVPARVLDIHTAKDGNIIMVEFLGGSESQEGSRIRHVIGLSPEDLENVPTEQGNMRNEARLAFLESLSPAEWMVLDLAANFGLKPFGYTEDGRIHYDGAGSQYRNPMAVMRVVSHIALRDFITQTWGPIDDLMTPEEKANSNWNVIDVFSRMTASYAMNRFKPLQGEQFIWVITEDGQLKICPQTADLTNLRLQTLRLGHGRKIYAAGTLRMNHLNQLEIQLDAGGYHMADGYRHNFDFAANPRLADLILNTFHLQARLRVSSIDSIQYEYVESDVDRGLRQARAQFAQRSGKNAPNSDGPIIFSEAALDSSYKVTPWDYGMPKDVPLEFQDWLLATGRSSNLARDRVTKEIWAHYVLKTTADTSYREIRMARAKLMNRFNVLSDTSLNRNDPRVKAAVVVNLAFQVFDHRLK